MTKLSDMEESDMNTAELAYYTEVHARILKKLTEIEEVSQAISDTENEISNTMENILNGALTGQ